MFTRLNETIRILTYREPTREYGGPDVLFIEHKEPLVTKPGAKIARIIQVTAIVFIIGIVVGPLVNSVSHVLRGRSPSLTVVAGSLGAILAILFEETRSQIAGAIQGHLHLESTLAPFFGKRLDRTIRALKGESSVSQ
jgi:hypothetical protein